eukprot:EG_transcript_3444
MPAACSPQHVAPMGDLEDVVGKLASVLTLYQQLLHDASTDCALFASVSKKINQWSSKRFHLVFVGPSKSGKSTAINCLLQKYLIPTDGLPALHSKRNDRARLPPVQGIVVVQHSTSSGPDGVVLDCDAEKAELSGVEAIAAHIHAVNGCFPPLAAARYRVTVDIKLPFEGLQSLALVDCPADFIPTPDLMYGAQSSLGVMYCFVLAAHELHTAATAQFLEESKALCPCVLLITHADRVPANEIDFALERVLPLLGEHRQVKVCVLAGQQGMLGEVILTPPDGLAQYEQLTKLGLQLNPTDGSRPKKSSKHQLQEDAKRWVLQSGVGAFHDVLQRVAKWCSSRRLLLMLTDLTGDELQAERAALLVKLWLAEEQPRMGSVATYQAQLEAMYNTFQRRKTRLTEFVQETLTALQDATNQLWVALEAADSVQAIYDRAGGRSAPREAVYMACREAAESTICAIESHTLDAKRQVIAHADELFARPCAADCHAWMGTAFGVPPGPTMSFGPDCRFLAPVVKYHSLPRGPREVEDGGVLGFFGLRKAADAPGSEEPRAVLRKLRKEWTDLNPDTQVRWRLTAIVKALADRVESPLRAMLQVLDSEVNVQPDGKEGNAKEPHSGWSLEQAPALQDRLQVLEAAIADVSGISQSFQGLALTE